MKVFINPLEPKGSRPWVRFAPGNGWSVFDTLTKGCHCPKLDDAVNDYNSNVQRKIAALNLGAISFITPTEEVNTLPGWGDAIRAERASRIASEETAKAHEAGKEARQRTPKPPAGLLALLSMAAAMGALDDILEDAPDIIDEESNPQIIKLLREAGIMKEIPGPIPGTVAGIVAIPRSFGEQFANDVENAIKTGNPTALLVLLSGAGLVP